MNLHGDQAQLPGINGHPDAFVTTTLPLVFFSSWVKDNPDIHNSGEPPVLKADNDQYNIYDDYIQSYPGGVPQFESEEENGDRQVSYHQDVIPPDY